MYPVLLYPSRIYDHGEFQGQLRAPKDSDRVPGTDFGMYFDLGVYGVPLPIKQGKPFKTVHAMRKMEDFTREVGGYPFLYADTFMTREEFGQMFNLDLYEKVRVRYHETVARLEVDADLLPRMVDPEVRAAVLALGERLGFTYVALDLAGFRSGSLNRVLVPLGRRSA